MINSATSRSRMVCSTKCRIALSVFGFGILKPFRAANRKPNQAIQPIAALWLNFSLFFRFPHRMNFTNPIMQRAHGFI